MPDAGVATLMWGYRIAGDTDVTCGSPGPVIRGRVGDVMRVTMTNLIGNEHPHNIDFHAVTGQGGGAADLTAAPGESKTIEARLLYPGAFMYHCAFGDVPEHIVHGMYGMVIVDPETPLPPGRSRMVDQPIRVVRERARRCRHRRVRPRGLVRRGTPLRHLQRSHRRSRGRQCASYGDRRASSSARSRAPSSSWTMHSSAPSTRERSARSSWRATPTRRSSPWASPRGVAPEAPPPGGGDVGGDEAVATDQVAIPDGAWDPANAAIAYTPRVVVVAAGSTVTWSNDDTVVHTVTSGSSDGKSERPTDASTAASWPRGESFEVTFTDPGQFDYYCTPHPWMKGRVTVEA